MEESESRLEGEEYQDGPTASAMSMPLCGNEKVTSLLQGSSPSSLSDGGLPAP